MNILIVEDNPADRELLVEALIESFPHAARFRTAASLKEAFAYLARSLDGEPYFDVVLLDLQLPDSSGRETFQAIHEVYPDLPIVILSHNTDQDLAVDCIRAGAQDVIIKDYSNPLVLFRRVLFAVERHRRPH